MSCGFCGNELSMENPAFGCAKVKNVCKLCTELAPSVEHQNNCIFCGQSDCLYEIDNAVLYLLERKCKIHNKIITSFCNNHCLVFCDECRSHQQCGKPRMYDDNSKDKIKNHLENLDLDEASSTILKNFDKILNENIEIFMKPIRVLKEFLKKFISEAKEYKIKLIEYTVALKRLKKGSSEIPIIESACFNQIFYFKNFCDEKKNNFLRTTYNLFKNSSIYSVRIPNQKSIYALKAQTFVFDQIKETKKIDFIITGEHIYIINKIFVGRTILPNLKGTFTYLKFYEKDKPNPIIVKENVEVTYLISTYFQEIEISSEVKYFMPHTIYSIEYEYVGSESFAGLDKSNEKNNFKLIDKDSLIKSRVFGIDLKEYHFN